MGCFFVFSAKADTAPPGSGGVGRAACCRGRDPETALRTPVEHILCLQSAIMMGSPFVHLFGHFLEHYLYYIQYYYTALLLYCGGIERALELSRLCFVGVVYFYYYY